MNKTKFSSGDAYIIALKSFSWIISQDEVCSAFLNATGSDISDLKREAENINFLASAMDFIAGHDAWIVACCDHIGLAYTDFLTVKYSLPGAAQVHWT